MKIDSTFNRIILEASRDKNYRGLLLCVNRERLANNFDAFKRAVGNEVICDSRNYTARFPNGARVLFKVAPNEQTIEPLLGLSISSLENEPGVQMDEALWETLQSRVRRRR